MRSIIPCLCVSLACTAHAATIEGKVVNVADGDTVTVLDASKTQHRIRIDGIDAPEKGQAFGVRSRESMARFVAGKEVTADCHKIDRYKRQVCKVWVQPADCPTCGNTLDAGHAQLVAGMAWWYGEYAKEQSPDERGRYKSAETEARARKVGLWHDKAPIPPWDWRRRVQ